MVQMVRLVVEQRADLAKLAHAIGHLVGIHPEHHVCWEHRLGLLDAGTGCCLAQQRIDEPVAGDDGPEPVPSQGLVHVPVLLELAEHEFDERLSEDLALWCGHFGKLRQVDEEVCGCFDFCPHDGGWRWVAAGG